LCFWGEGARPNIDADSAVPARGADRAADERGYRVRVKEKRS
jgi:hypothetical protein